MFTMSLLGGTNRMKIKEMLISFLTSILSGILYRLGGHGRPFNTKVRDFGCPTLACLFLKFVMQVSMHWWLWVLFFGLNFWAMTTYWKASGTRARWYNWAMTGFMYGFTALPFVLSTHKLLGFWIRNIVLTITITIWSELIDNDTAEEWGRGFLYLITLPLLFIGD